MLGVSWLAAVVVAFSGMYVAVEYTERTWLKQPIALGSVGGYLCLEALVIGLNPGGLFYTRTPTVVQAGTPVYEFGIWWTVHLFVVFVAATAMLGMFLEAYLTQSGAYRQQARTVLGGVVVIYLTAIIEVAGLEPYPDPLYNATMAGSTVLSVTFLWALFYADFLELAPIARRALLDDIDDAAIVLDHQDRLVYANGVAHNLFDTDPEYVGMPADDFVSSAGNQELNQLTEVADGKTEIEITNGNEKRYISAAMFHHHLRRASEQLVGAHLSDRDPLESEEWLLVHEREAREARRRDCGQPARRDRILRALRVAAFKPRLVRHGNEPDGRALRRRLAE